MAKWFENVRRIVLSKVKRKSPENVDLRRAPRIELRSLENLHFIPKDKKKYGEALRIANISTTGLGFVFYDEPWVQPGVQISGWVRVEESEELVTLVIVHLSSSLVGCAFVDPSASLRNWIVQYFDSELAAMQLRQVSPQIMSADLGVNRVWLWGSENCEIYYETKQDFLYYFYVSLFGNFFEGGQGVQTKFGYLTEEWEPMKIKASSLIHLVSKVPSDVIDRAVKFVQYSTFIDEAIKQQIVSGLQSVGAAAPVAIS